MTGYTILEQTLFRLHIIQYSLVGLQNACFTAKPPVDKIASSVFSRYAIVDFSQFIDYYHQLLGNLHGVQKQTALCFVPFLKELFENESGIRKLRNNWVAHIQDDDKFTKDLTELVTETGLPNDPNEYYKMSSGINAFIQAIRLILKDDFQKMTAKFNSRRDFFLTGQIFNIDLESIEKDLIKKYEFVKADTASQNLSFPWEQFQFS